MGKRTLKSRLGRRFDRWSLEHKICAGYGAAFIVAIAGIGTGFFFTQRSEYKVLDVQAEVMEDVAAIGALKGSLVELMIHTQQALNWREGASDPEASLAEFRASFIHLVEDYEQFKQDWQTLRESDEFTALGQGNRPGITSTEAETAAIFLRTHEASIDDYIQQFDELLKLDPEKIRAQQISLIQTALRDLNQSRFMIELDSLLDDVVAFSDAVEQEQEEATIQLQQAIIIHRSTMLISTVLSGILGLILMRLISRALCRPLRDMTQRTRRSIREVDLSLQIPITSGDEVGTLAEAFNNYTEFTEALLSRHKAVNEQLQTTLEELNRTQLQMVQQEKMSGLGHLMAGVAHEINNPTTFIYSNLTYIQTYAEGLLALIQLYQRNYPNPLPEIQAKSQEIDLDFIQTDLPKALSSVEVGSERICGIVRSLQNFSRSDALAAEAIDLHKGLDDTLTILGHRLKALPKHPAIEVIRNYGPLPPVECYPGLINQVFLNLLSNAIDALEDEMADSQRQRRSGQSPCIEIETRLVDEQWVTVTIADNGVGILQAVQQNIFNPFFTTKSIGKGTGMGLSISYQIVTERHGGELTCVSAPFQGTKFVVKIPVHLPPKPVNAQAEISSSTTSAKAGSGLRRQNEGF